MRFIIRLIVNAVAIYVAVALLNGRGLVMAEEDWLAFIWVALIFGVINTILKPILKIVGCPIIILTLGFGSLLINTLLFYLTALIAQQFQINFRVETFWGAFLGSIIVSLVSFVLNRVLRD